MNWGIKGVAGSAIIGGAAGGATMGVGAPVGGGIAGGALGGAAGAATSYTGTAALQGGEFSAGGLGRAVAVGTVTGFFGAAGAAKGGIEGAIKGTVAGAFMGFFTNAVLGGDVSFEGLGLSIGLGFASSVTMQGLQSSNEQPSAPNRVRAADNADPPTMPEPDSHYMPYPGANPDDPIGLFETPDWGPVNSGTKPSASGRTGGGPARPQGPSVSSFPSASTPPGAPAPSPIEYHGEQCTNDNPGSLPRARFGSLVGPTEDPNMPQATQWDGQGPKSGLSDLEMDHAERVQPAGRRGGAFDIVKGEGRGGAGPELDNPYRPAGTPPPELRPNINGAPVD